LKTTILTVYFLFCIVVSFAQAPDFTAVTTAGCSPLVVNFQNLTSGTVTGYAWDFGNGGTSTIQHPAATYFTPGTYTVTLTVTRPGGAQSTTTKTAFITVYGKPTIDFTVNKNAGCFPLKAQFTDLSVPSTGTTNTSWLWDFGDGTQSTSQNPLHSYTTAGNFSVTLKVTNDKGCSAVLPKTAFVQVTPGVTTAFTSSQPNVCKPPFNINFTNNSTGTGTLSWTWNFGDGNSSNQQNPSHSYTAPGNYTVTLITASSNGCIDTLEQPNFLNIQNVTTDFTGPDSICVNDSSSFLNASTPAVTSSVWNFSDGSSASTQNTVKTFSSVGTYTAQLINNYGFCSDSVKKTVVVLPRPVVSFSAVDTVKCQPSLTVNFTDNSTNAVSWFWDFGDGGTSTQQNPTHTYNAFGDYTVKLVANNIYGCSDSLIRTNYVKIRKPVISFPNMPVRGCIPFTLNAVANITTLDQVTSYFWEFGDGNNSSLPTPSHVYTVQGSYTVKLTITTSSGCTESFTLQNAVRVGRKPIVNFSANPTTVCAFQNVFFTDLTNEADEWLWQFGDGGSSNAQNPVHQYSDTGLFHVVLVATNFGCSDSLRINNMIRVKPPIAKFAIQPNCNNRLFFNFSDSSIGATSWFWEFGDGITSTQQNPSHTYAAFGNYTVKLTVTNDTCSHSKSILLKVIDESPNISTSFTTACKNSTFQFSAVVGDPTNIVSYAWNFGAGTTPQTTTSSNTAYFYTTPGTYTVTLVTTDIYGCKDTVVKTNYIRVNGPQTSFTGTNLSGCKGLTTTFTDASTTDGQNAITGWTWYFGDGNSQSLTGGGNTQHTYPNTGIYTVKLVIVDAAGCKDSMTRTDYVITSDPQAGFTADTLACPGSTVNFVNASTGNGLLYNWNFGDGNTTQAGTPTHSYTNTGIYTVSLVATDQYGCSDTLTRVNYIKVARPFASFTVNDSISSCTPFEVNYTNTSQYYVSWNWWLYGGLSTQVSPTQFYTIPGLYNISLEVISPGGCRDTAYANIRLYDTAGANITYAPLEGCKPLTVSLSAFVPGPMDLYTWDFGDGILTSDTLNTITHIYNSFGKFTPKVILTDPTGCIIPVTGLDTIRIKGASAKFGIDKKFFCDSGWVNFSDSTTYNDSLSLYSWDFGDGTTSNLQTPSHQYTTPGIYTISLAVLTENACVDTFRLVNAVKVAASPLIAIGGDSVICVNEFISHLGEFLRTDTSVVQWGWQFANGGSSALQNPNPLQYQQSGNFVIKTIATNSDGCKDTATKNILVHPLPSVSMPSTITKQAGFPVTIPATYSSNVISWNWVPASDLSCTDCPQPTAENKFNAKYLVSFVDSNGCKNTGRVDIIVICKDANVFVPNTFSPNGDGSNDVFYVRGKGLERVKSIRVFNRWGEVVFEQQQFPVNNPAFGWDGTYKGKKAVPDVYVYQVEVFCENSQIIRFEGNVALIK